MTEYESVALEKVLRTYKRDYARVVADALAQMPKNLESEVLAQLSTMNVYNVGYQDSLPVMRTNYGTETKAISLDFLSIAPQP